MIRTKVALENLVNYDAVTAIRPLEPPKIEKKDIPNFFICQNYDKALQKIDRTMERYNGKVQQLKERLEQSENNIANLKSSFNRVDPGAGYSVDKTNAQSVARYNDRLDQARRLQERISDAIGKHNEIIADHNDAIREAEEKLAEAKQEALLAIDDDIVAVLDKCTRIALKLSDSANSEDRIAAVETCFLEYKIYNSFDDHIDGNVARKDARERLGEVNKLFTELCVDKDVHNFLTELFHKNAYLIQKNNDLNDQVIKTIGSLNQDELRSLTGAVNSILEEKFQTVFEYQGVIDPSALDKITANIHLTIDSIKANLDKADKNYASTQAMAEVSVKTQQTAEGLLSTMKNNVETIRDDLLYKGHFAGDIIDEAVMDDFYGKEVKPAIIELRKHIVSQVGEEQIDSLLAEDADRFSIAKAETAIKQADLLQLQSQRDKIPAHINKLNATITTLKNNITSVGEVPRENAEEFRSKTSTPYALTLTPILGFIFALIIKSKIKLFYPAFSSTNEIYHKLCQETLEKNNSMQKISLIVGIALGIISLGVFLGLGLTPNLAISIGVPIAIVALYLLTWVILQNTGKELQSHLADNNSAR